MGTAGMVAKPGAGTLRQAEIIMRRTNMSILSTVWAFCLPYVRHLQEFKLSIVRGTEGDLEGPTCP